VGVKLPGLPGRGVVVHHQHRAIAGQGGDVLGPGQGFGRLGGGFGRFGLLGRLGLGAGRWFGVFPGLGRYVLGLDNRRID